MHFDKACAPTVAQSTMLPNLLCYHHHHQPNVPTAGAQAILMDYTYGERAITHHAGPVRVGYHHNIVKSKVVSRCLILCTHRSFKYLTDFDAVFFNR
jgi:hypothetical protein